MAWNNRLLCAAAFALALAPAVSPSGATRLRAASARYLYSAPAGPWLELAAAPGVAQLVASMNTGQNGWDYPVQTTTGRFGTTRFDDYAWYDHRDRVRVPNVAPGGGFHPSSRADGHLVVINTATQTAYDFWRLCADPAGRPLTCPGNRSPTSVGYITAFSLLTSNGAPGGGTASGLSGLTGDILPAEWKAGVIAHALSVIIPGSMNRPGPCTAAPATNSDGRVPAGVFCEGAILALDPSIAVAALPATPAAKILLTALQRYGGIITDQSDCPHCLGFYTALPGPAPDLSGIDPVLHAHLRIYYGPPRGDR